MEKIHTVDMHIIHIVSMYAVPVCMVWYGMSAPSNWSLSSQKTKTKIHTVEMLLPGYAEQHARRQSTLHWQFPYSWHDLSAAPQKIYNDLVDVAQPVIL